jgi:hypothetical protein
MIAGSAGSLSSVRACCSHQSCPPRPCVRQLLYQCLMVVMISWVWCVVEGDGSVLRRVMSSFLWTADFAVSQ